MGALNYAIGLAGLTAIHVYNYFHTNGFVLVKIDKGVLRGSNATTWRGEKYFSFKGIPYARPPVDELRFKGPREEIAWDGIRDAVHHGNVCPQNDIAFRVLRGEEDCLVINVYTPFLGDKMMPVMFWIHGGMFLLSSGNEELYGPDYFVESGVVLVTFNYRLGALGFLSTGSDDAPGNAGMKDQVAALKWVKRNIAKFGGDPDNVTIFGGSTGGACVHYHLLSPMSSGLFKRAISQSGSALNSWALAKNASSLTVRLAEALNAENISGNATRALNFLKNVSFSDIVRVQETMITAEERRSFTHFLFTPTVENNVESEEVFLPDSPLKIMESGKFNKVPYITGYNNRESYFFMKALEKPKMMEAALEDPERYVPIDIKSKKSRNKLAKSIIKFYFDEKPIGMRNISNLVNLYSDMLFDDGIKKAAKLHVRSVDTPTYFYVFSYNGRINLLKIYQNVKHPGAGHSDELAYLFHQKLFFWVLPKRGSEDERMIETMTRLWTNFAKYGNPTPPGDSLIWKPATIDEFNYLNVSGRNTKIGVDPDAKRSKFWRNMYEID